MRSSGRQWLGWHETSAIGDGLARLLAEACILLFEAVGMRTHVSSLGRVMRPVLQLGRCLHVRSAAWPIGVGLLLVAVVLVAPWGNYPLNDDWQYARAAKIFAETGHLDIDTPIAPSLVGQLLLAWPFIKVFGFSHTVLRVLTLTMAAIMLWAIDALLRLAEVSWSTRWRVLVLLALNPLLLNLALSFMTECYGYALALVGVVVWMRSRRACDAALAPAAVSLGAAVASGLLIGSSFWIRQYCVLAFPALVGATFVRLGCSRDSRRLIRSLWRVLAGVALFATAIAGYFAWARHYQLFNEAFAGPLRRPLSFDLVDYQVMTSMQLVYVTAAFFPLLATWPPARQRPLQTAGACVLALWLGLAGFSLIRLTSSVDAGSMTLHRLFPFAFNVVHTAGVGPNTLTDVFFFSDNDYAILSRSFWQVTTYVLVAATMLWGLPLAALRGLRGAGRHGTELFAFAVIFSLFSLTAVVQAFGRSAFDRHYLPIWLGVAIALAVLFSTQTQLLASPGRSWRSTVLFVVLTLPLAAFSVGGVHDYFRWNDARWRLVEGAMQAGIPPTSIEGGYEVNGWLSYDLVRKHPDRIDNNHCIGSCRCEVPWGLDTIWTCYDDSYRVGMSVRDDYVEIARQVPRFWLGKSHPVMLSHRPF